MVDTEIPSNFKTSLPPRKRAKTKEEKEQRRIERILRNRKAAHASREKKRKHVEFLETYVVDLEKQMALVKKLNATLLDNCYGGGNTDVDNLVAQIGALPNLKQRKLEHDADLDDIRGDRLTVPVSNLPTTPESYSSDSPKSSCEAEDARDLSIKDDSNSSDVSLADSPFISPEITNKFSLDIISSEGIQQQITKPIFVKQEEPFFVKHEEDSNTIPLFSHLDDLQVNSIDNDYVFDELRNPAVIAYSMKVADELEDG